MGKFTKGENPQTVALNFNTNAPLDDRTVVTTKASLIGKDTWIKAEYLFKGLITAVQETNELYMYIGNIGIEFPADFLSDTTTTNPIVSDETIAKYWKKISSSGLDDLAGVFKFKGVAESVSADLTYIVTCLGTSDKSILSLGTFEDVLEDVYYGWNIDGKVFWTESSTLNRSSTQYTRSKDTVRVVGVKYKDDFYYLADEMLTGGDDDNIKLQNLNGDTIYVSSGALPISSDIEYDVYSSNSPDETPIGKGKGFDYTGYQFTQITSPHTISQTYTAIQANEDNSGHVYQIEDNEYASNSLIWVKLGSPVDDWIIIP